MPATPLRLFLKVKGLSPKSALNCATSFCCQSQVGKAAVEEAQNSRFFYKAQAADEFAVAV